MANLTLYGSSVADGTFTTGCDMALNTTGGAETSKTSSFTGSGNWGELTSLGGSTAAVASLPSPPTSKKGWFFKPGAGSFATGNWSATVGLQENSDNAATEIRFWKYDGVSTFTAIGNITSNTVVTASRTNVAYAATSMTGFSTLSTDYIYVDLWWQDTAGAPGDTPKIFLSTSATQGIASDMQVSTSNFTPSGGATKFQLSDGFGGLFQ